MSLLNLEKSELDELAAKVRKDYEELKAMGLQLDLTRGKPAKAQLSLSNDLLELPGAGNYSDAAGNDLRNYGNLEGIKELRELWGKLTNIDPEQIPVLGPGFLHFQHPPNGSEVADARY